ncbi:hypothetical protein SDC9_131257 [bioreactor metagenome]|uniref:Uncharacterized protein n=1 Tax=bioreactor metagenome TaxID=1076179 RepID=A0A645D481_9ZZZZ
MAEICGWPADVVDIPLEVRVPGHLLRFDQNRSVASARHDAPLMKRQRAEVAVAETPARGGDGERNFIDRGDVPAIHGMRFSRIRQCVNFVQFLG